jgi:hypothetical protein
MKFSLSWLGEFVELPGEVEQLVDLLTLSGVEVEGSNSAAPLLQTSLSPRSNPPNPIPTPTA